MTIERAYFNVHKFIGGIDYDKQPLIAEGEQISLGYMCGKDAVPADMQDCKEFLSEYKEDRLRGKIKIGQFCEWYNERGEKIAKPTNEELDAKQWDVVVVFAVKPKNPAKPLAASGMWASAIKIRERKADPFEGVGFGGVQSAPINPKPVQEAPKAEPEAQQDPDFPF